MINRTRTQILSRTPRGLQGQGMDLGTRGAARGLVSLSISRPTRAR